METSGVTRLSQVTNEQLFACEQRIKETKKNIDDYKELKNKLLTLPDKCNYDKMIPLGPLAYVPGKLIHTNEIDLFLGSDFFVKTSAKVASKIIEYRISRCETLLNKLKEEQQQHKSWLYYADQTINNDLVEIIETCTNEEFELQKKQHRENVRKYMQQLKDFTINFDMLDETKDDVELGQIVDEHKDNINSKGSFLINESMKTYIDQFQVSEMALKSARNINTQKNSSDVLKALPESAELSNHSDVCTSPQNLDSTVKNLESSKILAENTKKRIRWKEEVEEEIPKILFQHSKYQPKTKQSDIKLSNPWYIKSPADIYNAYFSSPTKPILKIPPNFVPNVQPTSLTKKITKQNKFIARSDVSISKEDKPESTVSDPKPFIGLVKETIPEKLPLVNNLKKQSLFKTRSKKR